MTALKRLTEELEKLKKDHPSGNFYYVELFLQDAKDEMLLVLDEYQDTIKDLHLALSNAIDNAEADINGMRENLK